jgi:hypothetical protein
VQKQFNREMMVFPINGAGKIEHHRQKVNHNANHLSSIKLNSKRILIKCKIKKKLLENT